VGGRNGMMRDERRKQAWIQGCLCESPLSKIIMQHAVLWLDNKPQAKCMHSMHDPFFGPISGFTLSSQDLPIATVSTRLYFSVLTSLVVHLSLCASNPSFL
jgi:hypothetical protein